MKRITTILAVFLAFIFSCHKQEIERIPAPIGDGVHIDSSTFFEIDSAKALLICKIKKCEAAIQHKTNAQKAFERNRQRELDLLITTCREPMIE